MADATELRALARKIIGRVLAERGRAEHARGAPCAADSSRARGVHVVVEPGGAPLRPAPPAPADAPGRGAPLVTGESLRDVRDGDRFVVPRGARVTALAREEAWRRDIALVEGAAPPPDARREDGRVRIAVGADHGGFALKQELVGWLREDGHVVLDLGTHDANAVDYPDFARAVAESVAQGRADVGVCVDGAGIGSAMAANKVPGIRAANCWDAAGARNAREHNYANVLTLGGRSLGAKAARDVLGTFLATPWGEERHGRRVDKIRAIEQAYSRSHAHPRGLA
jgi:ribose 5-phosphate isomerase B